MTINWGPVPTTNFFLCLVIFILGLVHYWKHKIQQNNGRLALFIAIAFGLFGVSHLITLLGAGDKWQSIILAIRTFAYLFVILALCNTTFKE
ncbi:MAG: hypothetical protein PHU91_04120 [Candidatus Omnitrophica bacterium]|nr:hypothetical protein [Candidatus Omnitrophota bacterium]MDD5236827.1 hypothetical protein [Candidatus Omnitrophota bacterium]MDD5611171.1 hypothetical protein [Candidatus Omnitrophota bacterium]